MKAKQIIRIFCAALAFVMLSSCGTGTGSGTTALGNTSTDASEPTGTGVEGDTTTAEADTEPEAPAELTPLDKSKTYRVLFIGNSFTYYNNMNKADGIFKKITQAAGYAVSVDTVYKGGYYLYQFLDENDEYGKQVLSKLNSNVKYDFVIVQEQSAHPIVDPGEFYDRVRDFNELVKKNGAQMWLYETWGYGAGYSTLTKYGKDTYDMELKLRAAYAAIGEELNVPVVFAGAAMSQMTKEHPANNVYHTDIKHPSALGSTLIAYTIFGRIFGVDPTTVSYNGDFSAAVADCIREVAAANIQGVTVPDAYKTSSVGVHGVKENHDVVDSSKTQMLTSLPTGKVISVVERAETDVGSGWMTKKSGGGTFSGIRGDKDAISSLEYSDTALTDNQKKDIADIGYGVSVIGISHMDSSKKGTNASTEAGINTSVTNLVNGHWGSSYMAAMFFDPYLYDVSGAKNDDSPYTALITLNFGSVKTFDAIGYYSGSLKGFAQAQDVYVSDDGVNWTKVESACYDAYNKTLSSVNTDGVADPWKNNQPSVGVFFNMNGATGKYIRIGIIKGGVISDNTTGLQEINTREIVVYGK